MARFWTPSALAAGLALSLAATSATPQSGPSAAAVQLRQEAQAVSSVMQQVQPENEARLAATAGRIQAEIRRTDAKADPASFGSLQLSLATVETARAQMAGGEDHGPAFRALDAALVVLTRENAPYEWARVQQKRFELLDPLGNTYRGADPAAGRAAATAALSVFTRQAYPKEYLEIWCGQMGRMFATGTAEPDPKLTAKFEAMAPACPPELMMGGDAGAGRSLQSMMRSLPLTMLMTRAVMDQVSGMMGAGVGGGAARGAPGGQAQAQAMQAAMASSMGAFQEQSSGSALVGDMDNQRAGLLSASLAMERLALPEAQLRRARTLRAEADALAAQPEGADRTPMWRARAEIFDILAGAEPPAAPPPAVVDQPVVAVMMFDQTRGVAAAKPVSGPGDVAMTPGLVDQLTKAVMGVSMQEAMNPRAAQPGPRSRFSLVGRFGLGGARPTPQAPSPTVENPMAAMGDFSANTAARDWMRLYAAGDFEKAIDDFRARFEPAWSPVMVKAIAASGARPGGRVILLPDGASSMLPIGLLRDPATGRALIEDYEITFAPSLTVYAEAQKRAAQPRAPVLAGYAPSREESGLAFVGSELAMARQPFGAGGQQVLDPAAPKAAVLASLRKASYWHFATHGAFDQANPRLSWLQIGGGQKLTLNDLYASEEPMGSPRLVVLSACETGLFDAARNPDEFIGLPTGFIQAGAAGVIASLWQVDDVSATLLMAKFYALHLTGGEAPSTALRHAQLWLKGAEAAELAAFIQDEAAKGVLDAAQVRDLMQGLSEAGGGKPFSHPYHWGAFVYYGA